MTPLLDTNTFLWASLDTPTLSSVIVDRLKLHHTQPHVSVATKRLVVRKKEGSSD